MNKVTKMMSSLKPLKKAIVITIFTLLFSHVALYDLTTISYFAPMEKASDFRFGDFYTLVANKRADKKYEKDIVIVPVDDCNRRQIAEAISDIDFCAPAAVGLDIFFAPLSDTEDELLVEAISDCDHLVLPVLAVGDSTGTHILHGSCYDEEVTPKGGFAAINIMGVEGERTNIRDFRKNFIAIEDSVAALAAALVAIARPEAYKILNERDNDTEAIGYASRSFEVVSPYEILANKDLIKDRIVLVGKLKDRADQHITPINNYTPGLMIHAYTTATILDKVYIRQLSHSENILLGAILCFLVVWLNLHLMASVMGPLLIRSLQIGLLYFMILTGTLVYIYYRIDLNFSYSILTVSLGVAACEVYGAIFNRRGLIDYILINRRIIQRKLKNKIHEKKIEKKRSVPISDSPRINDTK